MILLKKLNKRDKIIKFICQHKELFNVFNEVYLFGSILQEMDKQNDIDLLLVYSQYSENILTSIKMIRTLMENHYKIPIDCTILSENELLNTEFLTKINNYLKIK